MFIPQKATDSKAGDAWVIVDYDSGLHLRTDSQSGTPLFFASETDAMLVCLALNAVDPE